MNIDKLIEVICLHGLPPKRTRGSLVQPNGYWVTIAKDTLNKCKPSQGYVKSVYNYWQLNIKGVQDKVLELLVRISLYKIVKQ